MSNDKEFEKEWNRLVPDSDCSSRNFEKAYAEIFWSHQQKNIDKKDEEIKLLRDLLSNFYHTSKTVTSQKFPAEPTLNNLRKSQKLYEIVLSEVESEQNN
jgi:hypothetical protein